MRVTGTTSLDGPELLIELDRSDGAPLRRQLEDELRTAVRDGRLGRGARLPSSRTLAADLGVSRRLVVAAYSQLCAEGYLGARRGSGTAVAALPHGPAAPASVRPLRRPPRPAPIDFFPGVPDLTRFPRAAWSRALRDALARAPDRVFGYPDPQGSVTLRRELAVQLGRARGVRTDAERIVICSGVTQALALLARVLSAAGSERIGVEDPSLPPHREVLAANGAAVLPVPVDEQGISVAHLTAAGAHAVVVTPAHQFPTGVALSPARRGALLDWATAGRLIVEDDYDAEFRYDRPPVGALQGRAPESVAYTGSVSKTLAPGLRLGWLALPAGLVEPITRARALIDGGAATLDQLALATLLAGGGYDRHLRAARLRHRSRRDALVSALTDALPEARVRGVAAGLHLLLVLPDGPEQPAPPIAALVAACRRRGVAVYPTGRPAELVLGYANLPEPTIIKGVDRLADALNELGGRPVAGA